MMVDKKGHKCRNIQEQVKKNKDDIEELKKSYPSTDFVINATKSADNKSLHITQKVDDEEEEFDFQGGKDLIAGLNINIEHLPNGEKISATTEPVGSVSFDNVVGSPYDNTSLGNELSNRVTLNTNQTISGSKTFQSFVNVSYNNNVTKYGQGNIRKTVDGTNYDITIPSKAGTFALTSDISDYHDETKQDKLTAGEGIAISEDNVISSTVNSGFDIVLEAIDEGSGIQIVTEDVWDLFHNFFVENQKVPSVVVNVKTTVGPSQYSYEKLMFSTGHRVGGLPERSMEAYGYSLDTGYAGSYHYSLRLDVQRDSRGPDYDIVEIYQRDYDYQDELTAGDNITIDQVNDVISAHINWGSIGGTLADQEDLKGALDAKQDKLTAGQNISIVNNVISATGGGEPDAYIKNASVSGNTLTLTKKDDSTISFTPSGSGGITDVKVNGSSVVTEGVANITIPEDAQLVYDMTLDLSTGAVTINNPNYYQRIKDYIEDNDKYPIIYGVVHIATQPDLVIICKDITIADQAILIKGYLTAFGSNYTTFSVIDITTTSSSQSAVYEETKGVNESAPRITKVEVTDNSIFFEDATGHDVEYSPTYNNLSDKPDLSQYQTISGLDTAVTNLGYIKSFTTSDLLELIEGSDFISIDENPDTEKLQFSFDFTNLDQFITFPSTQSEIVLSWTSDSPAKLQATLNQTVRNKINNSLQLPTTHTEETLVGVDTTGAQEQIKIGSGLSVSSGALVVNAKTIFDICHPVNSLYKTSVSTDMSTLSNGTWELAYQGKIGGTITNLIVDSDKAPLTLGEDYLLDNFKPLSSADNTNAYFHYGTQGGISYRFILANGHKNYNASTGKVNGVMESGAKIETFDDPSIYSRLYTDFAPINPRVNLANATGAIDVYIYKRTA